MILKVKVTAARSHHGHTIMLYTYNPPTNVLAKYQLPTTYGLQDRAWTRFKGQAQYKVKSRSCHDVAHLNPLTNVPMKYELPIPSDF